MILSDHARRYITFDLILLLQIADFGTSKCVQNSITTRLATYTADPQHLTAMSFAWAAPEVTRYNVYFTTKLAF